MSETISRSEAPGILYVVYDDDPADPVVTTTDEDAAYELADERDYRVVTYEKA